MYLHTIFGHNSAISSMKFCMGHQTPLSIDRALALMGIMLILILAVKIGVAATPAPNGRGRHASA